nr:uncharacterized protein LOC109175893 isoform X2 [Ipomoea trifida]
MPIISPEGKPLPCVIYCHGNSGSRADASEAAIILLPSNITVFALDFSGSGLSGGEHVTLGWNEKDDLKSVVEYLRRDGHISSIGLWGRSMGAVTSLLYGAQDPSIAGIVLDSPFSNLVDLMMEVAGTNAIRLPKFTLKFAIQFMRRSVLKKAKFDIMELDTIKVARRCFVPLLLGHAVDDDFIQPHHSNRIFDAYMVKLDYAYLRLCCSIDQTRVLQQGVVAYPAPSSSNLISFELSNGDPCGPGVLASIDDDEYVEYSLDNLADFSESMEDENKMIMEAVKESLKDLETRPSRAEELSSSTKQPESLSGYDSQGSATEQPVPSNESPTTPIVTNGHGSAPELQVADTNKTSAGPPNLIPSANDSENSGASADSNISVENPSSASIDLVDHTKVTVTVIKNPTTNIMNVSTSEWIVAPCRLIPTVPEKTLKLSSSDVIASSRANLLILGTLIDGWSSSSQTPKMLKAVRPTINTQVPQNPCSIYPKNRILQSCNKFPSHLQPQNPVAIVSALKSQHSQSFSCCNSHMPLILLQPLLEEDAKQLLQNPPVPPILSVASSSRAKLLRISIPKHCRDGWFSPYLKTSLILLMENTTSEISLLSSFPVAPVVLASIFTSCRDLFRAPPKSLLICRSEDMDSMAPGIPATLRAFCFFPASFDRISAAETLISSSSSFFQFSISTSLSITAILVPIFCRVSAENRGLVANFLRIKAPESCSSGEFEARSSIANETMSIFIPSKMLPYTHFE